MNLNKTSRIIRNLNAIYVSQIKQISFKTIVNQYSPINIKSNFDHHQTSTFLKSPADPFICLKLSVRMALHTAPFGSWKSPITSQLATESSVSFQELHVDKSCDAGRLNSGVCWTELRCNEAGRYVVCSLEGNDKSLVSWTPTGFSARTLVHEYGGGATFVHGGKVWSSNFDDQRIYMFSNSGDPKPVTPADNHSRYADGSFVEKHGKIYCVCEDHSGVKSGSRKEAENTVVVIDPESQQITVLTRGADFYASPCVSPDGTRIAWIQWTHPNMPWDRTELWTAKLTESGDSLVEGSAVKLTGYDDSYTSVMSPRWTSDNDLLYIGDQSEWWNLYQVLPSGEHINLHPVNKEIGGPHWQFADYGYDLDPSNNENIAASFGGVLGLLNIKDKSYKELDTGYTSHTNIQFGRDGFIYCVAGSPTTFRAVIRVAPDNGKVEVIQKSRSLSVDEGYLTVPQTISWSTGQDDTAHGHFYLPRNKDFKAQEGTLPPLLVMVHGGPTSEANNVLNLKIQYFTSRGFAILDVNYRGSTGYGKTYRHKLQKNWGIYDVEDCCSGATYLAETKQVDGGKLCIDGGSAGGYTTLACLAFKDVFKAGASHYGVADVEILMQDTHKFESRYCDTLIGPYTEEYLPQIQARSPIKHIDGFSCPVIFFQGDDDKIVPPNQAEMMYNAVKAKGIPCAYVLFPGEQHGFRKSENIQKALDGEFYFYSRVFGFTPADKGGELPITNMD